MKHTSKKREFAEKHPIMFALTGLWLGFLFTTILATTWYVLATLLAVV